MFRALADSLLRDRLVILRFGLVGVAATAVHMAVALLVQHLLRQPFIANFAGFLTAFVVSFLGHALWTFRVAVGRRRAAARFFFVSASSFLFSNLVLAGCVSSGLLHPQISLLISIAAIPACNYILARVWVFEGAAGSRTVAKSARAYSRRQTSP